MCEIVHTGAPGLWEDEKETINPVKGYVGMISNKSSLGWREAMKRLRVSHVFWVRTRKSFFF